MNMFSNKFTEYLIQKGWKQTDPVTFVNPKRKGIEIFFDNSNHIEIYNESKRISSHYATEIEDLISIFNSW